MSRRIENEEQYEKSLSWLVSKAGELSDPLLSGLERDKLQRTYDFVASQVQFYRRSEMVAKYPGLREVYQKLGWQYGEMETSAKAEEAVPERTPEEPVQPEPTKQEQEASINLSLFVDDD